MSTKQKLERLITPIGEAKWAHVNKPKEGYNDGRGGEPRPAKYQIDIYFDPASPEWKKWVEDITASLAALPQQTDKEGEKIKKQKPLKRELDENDKPTGRLYATFKTGAEYRPGVFDKYKQVIPETVLIGNGSKVRVNYSPSTFEGFGGGINFYLNAVQVMELVEYSSKNAEAYGFDGEKAPQGAGKAPEDDNIPF
jgi:hypothetical protein